MADTVIRAEGLGKKYVIGHQARRERYVALRDVLAHGAKNILRKTAQLTRGRNLVPGDILEDFWALRDVSFEVKRGEVLGIIGRNGAGKSTLLKVLSRITEPSEGRVSITGRVASLLEVGTGFHPELTGRENIFLNGAILGMTRAEIRRKFDEIVAFAEVEKFLDTPVKRYSSGMYVRLAFAVAAHLEPEILVVDEVLAVGDAEFQKKCLGKMSEVAGGGRTVLFVSHNMHSVSQLCGRGIVLAGGRLIEDTTIDAAIAAYSAQAAEQVSSVPHVIFDETETNDPAEGAIVRVEMLDTDKSPKAILSSRGAVVFRIWIRANAAFRQGAVILSIATETGVTLAKFESNPQRCQPVKHAGDQYVDCCIDSLPLMPGRYWLGVGLGHHGVRLIEWKRHAASIFVADTADADFEMSAYPEGPLVIAHRWED